MSIRHFFSTLCAVGLTFVPALHAQQESGKTIDSDMMKAAPVKQAMDRLEKRADDFKDRLGDALDKSSYKSRDKESLMRWADMVEDQIDDMVKEFKHKNTQKYIAHFENAMIAASAINRAMLRVLGRALRPGASSYGRDAELVVVAQDRPRAKTVDYHWRLE